MSAGVEIALDGHKVFVGRGGAAWGGGQRPRVVLMHGAGMDHTIWVLLGRWLARHGYDVMIPDLPGHGRSGGDALTSIEAMSDWLPRLLEALQQHAPTDGQPLGDGPISLIGHSMGALIAADTSQRVDAARVVLLGVGYPMQVGPPLLAAAEANDPLAADMITAYGHAYASRLGHNPLPGISVANMARVLLLRARPGVLHTDLNACNEYRGIDDGFAARLPETCAVHIIAGSQDRMTPAKACKQLAETLAARSVQWLPDSGHMMMSEFPEQTLQAVRNALQ